MSNNKISVLITKDAIPFFQIFDNQLKFVDSTETTCTFKIPENNFTKLYLWVKSWGYNPYEAMTW